MSEPIIEFKNVRKAFDGKAVLDGVSFEIGKGEVFVVLGPSGTGKSVCLKHIVGLLEPDSGEVRVKTDRIGYLFQSGALLAWMTVAENVALPLEETTDLSDDEIDRRVAAVFHFNPVGRVAVLRDARNVLRTERADPHAAFRRSVRGCVSL